MPARFQTTTAHAYPTAAVSLAGTGPATDVRGALVDAAVLLVLGAGLLLGGSYRRRPTR